ncbi:hypothetical protein [Massilia sp. AB1]|uniref:hypothetical protein n=1 Tax=Massilia sp. AB1 TaxID=2823371 RepID=UPI001B82C086|nr:hypothetical protein [Massilia sp. AB1]MBQ5940399.1 hypothetical protein [Massilia sp. AB1]
MKVVMFGVYRRYARSSKEQLRQDFGTYPPAPLRCQEANLEFVVVQVRGPGRWLNYWRRSAEVLGAFELDRSLVATELLPVLVSLSRCTDDLKAALPAQPLPHPYIAPRFVVRLTIMMALRRFEKSRKRGLAYFVPLTGDDQQVTVLGKAGDDDHRIAAILAHEHVHFLQNRHRVKPSKGQSNLSSLLTAPKGEDHFVLYLLEPLEVEARLHELVLSYYRDRQALPQTVDAFLGLLADWHEFGEYLAVITIGTGLSLSGTGREYRPRSLMFGDQLGTVLGFLKDGETTMRYITEVLPVMYGHLLMYYGDVRASEAFLAQLARPNLYDELYGSAPTGAANDVMKETLMPIRFATTSQPPAR